MCADRDLTFEGIQFLVSNQAIDVLDWLSMEAATKDDHLRLVMRLRKDFTVQETGWLLDQMRLRRKAIGKFSSPGRCLYLDEALQQASSLPLAHYHARQFTAFKHVGDFGCGIGADTLALAESVTKVTAVELDSIRAELTNYNVHACGLEKKVRVKRGDWTQNSYQVEAAFIDPARRVEGKRVFSLFDMQPSLDEIVKLQLTVPNLLVKAAPGVNHDEVPIYAELEFVSLKGEMKEALLRFGKLRKGWKRCATLLPGGEQLVSADFREPEVTIGAVKAVFYEPDPAVLRARLVRHLAVQIGAAMIDPEIAYLTSDQVIETPFARSWQVLKEGHFHLKTLNHWLRELDAGEVVIKKRGSPIDVDAFQQRLKTNPNGRKVTVFFTQKQGEPWMIVGQE